jgi:uncharacterized membrane protein YccC
MLPDSDPALLSFKEVMHYALNLRTFLYSHYFYLGLRVAIGVLGLTLVTSKLAGTAAAMTVCIGALCTSLMDMPSPLRHKFNEMMAAALLCTAVTLVISLCGPLPGPFKLLLVATVTFLASMMVVYGKKSLPLQLAALFIMTMSIEHEMTVRESFTHSALLLAGALCYVCYAMVIAWFLRHRIKQQVLAEALFELAHYVTIKADFYNIRHNLNQQFNQLVRHQSLLADRQQASRDLILRGHGSATDAIVVQVHVCMLDLYELILSTHTDYAQLRAHLSDSDALHALHRIACKAARDIETVAYAVTRKRASHALISYEPELAVIEDSLRELEQISQEKSEKQHEKQHEAQHGAQHAEHGQEREQEQEQERKQRSRQHSRLHGLQADEALAVLRAQRDKLQRIIAMIAQLHRASAPATEVRTPWQGIRMDPLLSQQQYKPGLMLSNMHMQAPIFRFALRLALAVTAGMLIGPYLPYGAHSYWIILTIVFILRPSYSVTKQRRSDRVAGTIIGCLLTALTLHFIQSQTAILAVVFVAMVAAPTFIQLRYRYTSVAVSMLILLQLHLIAPGSSNLISERLIDTAIGALLAGAFSFVLATWEYKGLPHLTRQVLRANIGYMEASFRLLQGQCEDDLRYRVGRKRLMDSLAALSSALTRMLDEPPGKQHAIEDVNLFIVQNYLLVAHVAALRSLLERHQLPQEGVQALLQQAQQQMAGTLAQALEQTEHEAASAPPASAAAANLAPVHGVAEPVPTAQCALSAPGANVPAWPLLKHRIKLLQDDAERITSHRSAIARSVAAVNE